MAETRRVVQIVIDASQARAGADSATQQLKRIGDAADVTSSAVDKLRFMFLHLAAVEVVSRIGDLSDSFTNMAGRLKLVLANTEDVSRAQADLLKVANESQGSYEATSTLFTRLAFTAAGARQGYANLLTLTRAMNDALRVSGATAKETSSILIQFSQAMQKGVLNDDEFKALSESGPRVMKALADGLGLPVGKLKELSTEGKLTAEKVLPALLSQAEKLRTEAQGMGTTVGGAYAYMTNKMTEYIGKSQSLQTIMRGLGESIRFLADNLWLAEAAIVAVSVGALPLLITRIAELGRALMTFAASNPFTALLVVATIAAVEIYNHWDKLKTWFIAFVDYDMPLIAAKFSLAWTTMKQIATSAVNVIGEAMSGILSPLGIKLRIDTTELDKETATQQAKIKQLQDALDKNQKLRQTQEQVTGPTPKIIDQGSPVPPKVKKEADPWQTAMDTLGGDVAQLEFKIKYFEEYAKTARSAAEAEAVFQTTRGKFKDESAEHKLRMIGLAIKKDELVQELEFLRVREQFNEAQNGTVEKLKAETTALSLNAAEREKLIKLTEMDVAFHRIAKGMTDEQVAALKAEHDARKKVVEAILDQQRALQRTAEFGAKKAFDDYADDATNAAKNIHAALTNAFSSIEDTMVKAFTTGKFEFKDMVNSILSDMVRLVVRQQITGPLVSMLGDSLGGLFGGLFGQRAVGGTVAPNEPYWVGERGTPEVFVPDRPGRIVPASQVTTGASGQGGSVNITVNVESGRTTTQGDPGGATMLGRRIGDAVRAVIAEEQRQGGMLAKA